MGAILNRKIAVSRTSMLRRSLLAFSIAAFTVGTSLAQDAYPRKPVRIVVPFAPGGPNDVIARTMSERLGEILGQPVIVENKPGANNQIGVDAVLNAPADGYTVLLASQSSALVGVLNPSFRKDLKRELVGVSSLVKYPTFLVVKADLPVRNFAELMTYGKANPGKLNFGAQGASDIIAMEALIAQTGIDMTLVRYGSFGPATTALMAGQVDVATYGLSSWKQFSGSNKARVIAVLGPERVDEYPDVIPITTTGAPGFEFASWCGLLVRTGTPDVIVKKLHDAIATVLTDPAIEKRFKELGLYKLSMNSEKFTSYWTSEIDRWTGIAKKANFKPD